MAQEKSEAFREFLKEINEHFVHVMEDRLRWAVLDPPQYIQGNGNVVIRFRTAQGLFIFRVPKFSQFQLRSVGLAYAHFGRMGVMPELVYKDGKCVIERYAEGITLSAGANDATIQALARRLAEIHTIEATGFGRLTHGNSGWYANVAEWAAENVIDFPRRRSVDREEDELSADENRVLEAMAAQVTAVPESVLRMPTRVCHGDLWRSNVIVGADSRITLIDWDTLGAYPREGDLIVMVDAGFDARQKALFLEAYGDDTLDAEAIAWLSLRRIARSTTESLRQKIAKARHHGLLR